MQSAPSLDQVDGGWRVYYAGTTFGSRRSAVGLATATDIEGPWTDRGGTGKAIVNQHSNLCLDNWQFNANPGAEVRWYTCNNDTVQRRRFAWHASSDAMDSEAVMTWVTLER